MSVPEITPVINPPQAAILGVGATRALPAIVGGELTERHVLTCGCLVITGSSMAPAPPSCSATSEVTWSSRFA